MPFQSKAFATLKGSGPFVPHTIERRDVGDNDVHIKILYAGICHSDIHQAREEWGPAIFPMVPGHEIVGRVAATGKGVTKFKNGDIVGVGCFVDSCRGCPQCKASEQQYCKTGMVATYNDRFKYPHCAGYSQEMDKCEPTYGGYSQDIVVDAGYVLSVPPNIPVERAAPLLCAGITVYSPMRQAGVKAGTRVGVAGLGGLGSMAVKLGVAMGAQVTVLSRGTKKKAEATGLLGAQAFIDSTDPQAMAAAQSSFDCIVDTIAAAHDVKALVASLDVGGKLLLVGAAPYALNIIPFDLIMQRKSVCGSLIGGINETQEMLDFCGKHNVSCEVEVISPEQITEAYDRAVAGDVRYRFSIDVSKM